MRPLDLNLLPALHALLQERNVTRAGRHLGLSQPSMSALLSRLRRHFDDALLVRVGNRYELTPLGVTLRERAAAAINIVERTFTTQSSFDPATSTRVFSVFISDYAILMLGDALIRLFRDRAPQAHLRLQEISVFATAGDVDAILRTVDGVVLPHGILSGYPAIDLYHDRWVGIAAADNALLGDEVDLDQLAKVPWVVTVDRSGELGPPMRRLRSFGVEPIIEVGVENNFQSLPFLVAGTNRVAVVQEQLARRFQAMAKLRILALPFDLGPVIDALWWHPAHSQDPAHQWLRDLLGEASRAAARPVPAPGR